MTALCHTVARTIATLGNATYLDAARIHNDRPVEEIRAAVMTGSRQGLLVLVKAGARTQSGALPSVYRASDAVLRSLGLGQPLPATSVFDFGQRGGDYRGAAPKAHPWTPRRIVTTDQEYEL